MVRAIGDAQYNDVIACLSPLGLATRSQLFVNNYIWPTLMLLLITVVISAIAYKLNTMRDLGQGFIAAKPGRANAPRSLQSPFGLSWRLLRTALISWIIVMFMLGGSYGSVMGDLPSFIGESPEYLQVIGIPQSVLDTMTDAEQAGIIIKYFGAFITIMMTLVSIVPILNAAMRPRKEEHEDRAEHIIARVVSRPKYMCGFVTLAFAASVLLQFSMASGLYLSTGAMTEINPFNFGEMMKAYFSFLPAMWVMIGFAVFVIGLLPRISGAAVWGFFGYVAFVSFLGSTMDLPKWMYSISPLHHVPLLPLEEFAIAPLIILTAVAAVLTFAGFFFYSKRDTLTGV
jgi:ABC-2 type transport system permease protein